MRCVAGGVATALLLLTHSPTAWSDGPNELCDPLVGFCEIVRTKTGEESNDSQSIADSGKTSKQLGDRNVHTAPNERVREAQRRFEREYAAYLRARAAYD